MDKFLIAFKKILNSKKLRYGSSSLILTALVIAVAVFVNVIVGLTPLKWDLTPNKLFSISDITKNVLNKLDKDVVIYGFFDTGRINSSNDLKEISELLSKYGEYKHIKIKYIDPVTNPGYLTDIYSNDKDKIQEAKNAICIVKCGDKIKALTIDQLFETTLGNDNKTYKSSSIMEQSFTDSIVTVTSGVIPKIYYTTGHDETQLDDNYKIFSEILRQNGYEIDKVDLILNGGVPADATILAVFSPKKDLTEGEKESIQKFLDNGGKVAFLFDPINTGVKLTRFNNILSKYYLTMDDDKVMEPNENYHYPKDPYTIKVNLLSSIIYRVADGETMAVPDARSINILKNKSEDIEITSLANTSQSAKGLQIPKTNGKDIPGPMEIAVAAENKGAQNPSRILVVGNSQFLSDEAYQNYGDNAISGLAFFVSSLNWMQDKKSSVSIDRKSYDVSKIQITDAQANTAALCVAIVFPIIILGFGFFVWLKRRHL